MSGTGVYKHTHNGYNWIIRHLPNNKWEAYPEYEKWKIKLTSDDYLKLIGDIMLVTDRRVELEINNPKFMIEDNNG